MAKTVLHNVLKLVMILICVGFVSLWIVKPTGIWTGKWKEAEDTLRPTILGYYGLDFLVFTFPIIALAILGSIYMNLISKKPNIRQHGRKRFYHNGLRNPVIINTIVGTLSAMEIFSVTLFAIFLTWTFYARISNDFNKLVPIKTLTLQTWQLRYMRVATRFGLLTEVCLVLLLLPILRGLSLFRVIGVQFEASVRYHVWLGTAMICFASIHGLSTLLIWGLSHHFQEEIWRWQKKGRIYLAGEITLVAGLVIWITALPQIRRRKFEIFYYTHHLYIVFIVFFLFHAGDRHFYSVFGGIFLFGLDKLLRIIQSKPQTCLLSAKILPCNALELVLPKDSKLKYTPTSVLFMKIPSISKLQWHSFSISSSSNIDEHTMSVVIRCQGSWTTSLHNLLIAELESDSDKLHTIPVEVEGPYGPASIDFLRYDNLLLVAGGVGITPFLSIIQEIASHPKNPNQFPTTIQLIHVVKKSQDIGLLNSITHLLTNQSHEKFNLKLKLYMTQEQHQSGTTLSGLLNEYSQIETVRFCPDGSSYAINGLESSVSAAFIAGISTIVFLVFLICFSHIFVHNVKEKSMKEAKEKTPSSVVDLIIILSFFIAMISASLFGVLVRRRRIKRGVFSPESEKSVKPWQTSSVESGLSLDKHEIHFTGRPNFRDVFAKFESENRGSDIGVLVCGPEGMMESVALHCRQSCQSGSTKKTSFNFHSLTFAL